MLLNLVISVTNRMQISKLLIANKGMFSSLVSKGCNVSKGVSCDHRPVFRNRRNSCGQNSVAVDSIPFIFLDINDLRVHILPDVAGESSPSKSTAHASGR